MEYISLRLCDIPELVVPIRMSLIKDAANKEATETRVPLFQGDRCDQENYSVKGYHHYKGTRN
jgi:hypothetical protein